MASPGESSCSPRNGVVDGPRAIDGDVPDNVRHGVSTEGVVSKFYFLSFVGIFDTLTPQYCSSSL